MELEKLVELSQSAKDDAEKCVAGNKSAGRRARKTLMELASLCKNLRKQVLEAMKGDESGSESDE